MAKSRQLTGWRWWAAAIGLAVAVSAVLHFVIAAVVWLTPLKGIVFPEEVYRPPKYDAETIQSTADDTRRDMARKWRKKLAGVRDMLVTLVDMRDRKAKEKVNVTETLGTTLEKDGVTMPLESMSSLYALYSSACRLEAASYDAYETWRALTLADQQQIPWEQAKEVTKIGRPTRREGKRDILEGPIRTLPTFKEFRDEVIFAKNEIDSIAVGVQRMRDLVEGLDSPGIGRDHTIAIQLSGTLYQGSGGVEFGASVGPPLLADEIFPSGQSKLQQADFHPLPGRKVSAGGEPMQWMYLDTWYFIGPFPNPGRQNLDKKFPPESVVDLDASYVGKHDRTLRWRFRRYPIVPVVPLDVDSYAIWYGYTEVWSDAEKEYWFMMGSDDYGKLWVNGALMWASGKTPHHYIPDRGFKKIKLNRGPNRLLFKIENAGGTMGFSVILAVQPQSATAGTGGTGGGGSG